MGKENISYYSLKRLEEGRSVYEIIEKDLEGQIKDLIKRANKTNLYNH
jgi:hypothetical protein